MIKLFDTIKKEIKLFFRKEKPIGERKILKILNYWYKTGGRWKTHQQEINENFKNKTYSLEFNNIQFKNDDKLMDIFLHPTKETDIDFQPLSYHYPFKKMIKKEKEKETNGEVQS